MNAIWWIRHAPIEQTGRYTGQSDVEAIIPIRAAELPEMAEDALWFSSPLKRCVQTAQWLGSPVTCADALKEQHFGQWEGRFYDEVWAEAQHRYDWDKPETIRPPSGESFMDMCERVSVWLDKCSNAPMVIIAHAGVIRAGLRHALKLDAAQTLALQVEYGSVTHVSGTNVVYTNRLL